MAGAQAATAWELVTLSTQHACSATRRMASAFLRGHDLGEVRQRRASSVCQVDLDTALGKRVRQHVRQDDGRVASDALEQPVDEAPARKKRRSKQGDTRNRRRPAFGPAQSGAKPKARRRRSRPTNHA
ncbi:MAG: hypothetical protein MHM6MM_003004 [Cercozoa sp. M6MM]